MTRDRHGAPDRLADPRVSPERYVDALTRADAETTAELLAEDCLVEVPGARLRGSAHIARWVRAFLDAFPDRRLSHGDPRVDGETVTVAIRMVGRQTRPLATPRGTLPATGRTVDVHGWIMLKVSAGRVVRARIDLDELELRRQLGIR